MVKLDDEKNCDCQKVNKKKVLIEKIINERMKQIFFLEKQCNKRQLKITEYINDIEILRKILSKHNK